MILARSAFENIKSFLNAASGGTFSLSGLT